MVLLHVNRESADQSLGLDNNKVDPQKVWRSIAEQNDFILVVPNGSLGVSNQRGWNDCRNDNEEHPQTDDVLFISELLQKIQSVYNFNANKVFIAGIWEFKNSSMGPINY